MYNEIHKDRMFIFITQFKKIYKLMRAWKMRNLQANNPSKPAIFLSFKVKRITSNNTTRNISIKPAI